MKKFILFFAAPALLVGAFVLLSGTANSPVGVMDPGADATFVGSDACNDCHHTTKFAEWEASGHPYKFTVTPTDAGPVYPVEAVNFQDK